MQQSAFCSLSRFWLLCVPLLLLLSACGTTRVYNQRTMFRLSDGKGLDTTRLRGVVNRVNRNYIIQPNDLLAVRVYTNNGERIIDPNGELQFGAPAGMLPTGTNGSRTLASGSGQPTPTQGGDSEFTVQTDGTVRLPLINRVRITGYTLLQADSVLKVRYEEFYKGVFVVTRVTNSRVVVLGSVGGRIVPLVNDNMNLIEVLAAAGGVDGGGAGSSLYRSGGKASNIRIIRGDLKNPQVEQIDLTTINGMRRANLQVEPNDIIYIEPVRRPFSDALADASPVLGLSSVVLSTLYLLISVFR
ncbi:polysaccharide biosynthesis/export family protein [Hymenobacter volaticus]|uniref:Polysaccharide biosynthesis/export family protein n=1 Tax=Hymenobacter volaticus TaxID=2932254 RepID=A0ABY4G4I3_9BACT|nr:polysaccharide biosynthesis/export family protein [Hymenobacter volaticus]UOQ65766.1 polysaccharide biosynthesis/export family protein [Hymenobacter volaticus]